MAFIFTTNHLFFFPEGGLSSNKLLSAFDDDPSRPSVSPANRGNASIPPPVQMLTPARIAPRRMHDATSLEIPVQMAAPSSLASRRMHDATGFSVSTLSNMITPIMMPRPMQDGTTSIPPLVQIAMPSSLAPRRMHDATTSTKPPPMRMPVPLTPQRTHAEILEKTSNEQQVQRAANELTTHQNLPFGSIFMPPESLITSEEIDLQLQYLYTIFQAGFIQEIEFESRKMELLHLKRFSRSKVVKHRDPLFELSGSSSSPMVVKYVLYCWFLSLMH